VMTTRSFSFRLKTKMTHLLAVQPFNA
jgi:hypothetical protein